MQDTIDIKDILYLLRKRLLWIIAGLLLGFVVLYLVSAFVLPPKYTSSVELYVNNNKTSSGGDYDLNSINASQKLVNTYIVILQNDDVLSQVSDRLSQPMTNAQLREVLTMRSVNQTEVLRISAETVDPNLSAEICNIIAEVGGVELPRVVEAGSVKTIGRAKASNMPSSPNVWRNSLIGALIGLVIALGLAFLVYLFDNTIKGEDDLQQRIDVPVLGEIPHLTTQAKGGKKHVSKKK